MKRGAFLTFEGGDGVGKSTQIARLADHLRGGGHDVVTTREPGGSPGAEAIRALIVRGGADRWSALTDALLVCAARRDHLERTIIPARARGAIVLCDRFSDSTMAYQGVAGGLGADAAKALDAMTVGTEGPDLTIILDAPVSVGLARAGGRGGDDRFEGKGAAFQEKVRAAFLAIAAADPARCVVIDAGGPADVVAAAIRAEVKTRIGLR